MSAVRGGTVRGPGLFITPCDCWIILRRKEILCRLSLTNLKQAKAHWWIPTVTCSSACSRWPNARKGRADSSGLAGDRCAV